MSPTVKFELVKATEIDDELLGVWNALLLQRGLESLPFLRPEYIRALAKFRDPLMVCVARDSDGVCALLPFERQGHTGQPPGVLMSDYQCLLRRPGVTVSVSELMTACGLTRLKFNHLLVEDSPFSEWHDRVSQSYWIDLRSGSSTWENSLLTDGGGTLRNAGRKDRKLGREHGPVTFEWHSGDPRDFRLLNRWKSAQRERTGTFDVLKLEWVQSFLAELLENREPQLQPVLSTLRVADQMIAASLGIHCGNCYYDWFPAYDMDFARFSPGLLLTVRKIREAEQRGIERFDFGKGAHQQKLSLSNAATPVANAVVDLRPLHRIMHRLWVKTVRVLKSPQFQNYTRLPKQIIRAREFRRTMK